MFSALGNLACNTSSSGSDRLYKGLKLSGVTPTGLAVPTFKLSWFKTDSNLGDSKERSHLFLCSTSITGGREGSINSVSPDFSKK